ncbi:EamA family transporter [Sphingomonas sp. CGMCC 1.13654]|uniref:EamA family transporter n=1 Tax=Sphingomonas chungangi TaxID=2683589 RepID=A0A838LBL4_9SPHN|nr:EamA family transporter [Sphingomonas chungangi]MBA2934878.1 EamA family transporter [Sphingomonas chungangi]MVW58189.1 EamA family transporter [Sphingomonas chungangi]
MSETLAGTKPLGASQRARVAVPFMVCTLVWSSTWLVIRYQLGVVPPSWSVAYRFLIACVAMMAYARFTGTRLKLAPRGHGLAAVYGLAQYCLNYYFVYLAERTVTSGLVAVVFALLVVPNALFAWIFLKQGVSRAFIAGSAVALVGLALLFGHELAAAPASRAVILIGIGWSLAAVLFSSIANVMQASRPAAAIPVATLIAWGMAWGSLFNCAGAFAMDGPPVFDPHPGYWLGTLYLALIGSALAFSCYFYVIRAIGPGRAAYSSVLSPVLAMLLSTLFEGYRWSLQAGFGCLLAIAGLVVALQARQAARPAR